MADSLCLSLWFSDFDAEDMLPRALSVLRAFPFSTERPGVTYLALHPVSWNEATVLERRCDPGITPEAAVLMASDLLHEDYAYIFEVSWDLWVPWDDGQQWTQRPSLVRCQVHGIDFDEGIYRQEGSIEVDFGPDSPFLYEELRLTGESEDHVRDNVQKLVDFTVRAEKSSEATARLLWSESEENLAQKLIARLQKVQ